MRSRLLSPTSRPGRSRRISRAATSRSTRSRRRSGTTSDACATRTAARPTSGRGTIRVLHDRSFIDDPTRIFRAIRYENRLGFRMDDETERLAREGMTGVALLSAARFREEVVALLSEGGIAHTLERLADFGGAPAVDIGLVERLDALRDELDPGAPLWRLRLAVISAEHPGLVERLSLRREDARAVEDAVALAPALAEASDPVEIADLAGRAPDAALLALARGDSAGPAGLVHAPPRRPPRCDRQRPRRARPARVAAGGGGARGAPPPQATRRARGPGGRARAPRRS